MFKVDEGFESFLKILDCKLDCKNCGFRGSEVCWARIIMSLAFNANTLGTRLKEGQCSRLVHVLFEDCLSHFESKLRVRFMCSKYWLMLDLIFRWVQGMLGFCRVDKTTPVVTGDCG